MTATNGSDGRSGDEQKDFIDVLGKQRGFLRQTTNGMTDEQARLRPTVSALCLGGIVKHVTLVEQRWVRFIDEGAAAMAFDESSLQSHLQSFEMLPDETLTDLLTEYADVARRTDERIRTLDSLDVTHPLPEAPWFEPGGRRSARRVLTHVLAETAQHAGHADIIREAIDGAKTMG